MSKLDPSSAATRRTRAWRAQELQEALSQVGVTASTYVYPANGNAKIVLDPTNTQRLLRLLLSSSQG
jgi:alpha-D-ribose 1-methylphosphonate 5-phosphate C-P lyase